MNWVEQTGHAQLRSSPAQWGGEMTFIRHPLEESASPPLQPVETLNLATGKALDSLV